jgi:hypothetical protein
MAPRARADCCGQVVEHVVKHVVKAVGTGNNRHQRGVYIHYRGTVHKEGPHASNV